MTISENVKTVLAQVTLAESKSGLNTGQKTTVIGVTKYVDAVVARELVAAGITNIAENRTELFLDKQKELSDLPITWHLIGTLQRRKVKDVINSVDYFHALDSVKLAREIDKRADHVINCFLQVNISGETSKHGFSPEVLGQVLPEISSLSKVNVVGLMTMAPIDATDDELADVFTQAKNLQETIASQKLPHIPCTELSMGMSQDYQQAIQHGATFVRIGSKFF
ncbi:MAG: YggS family pyridoxal phosphate-dependent enzyme [Streptococcaceae bacterium]|jgi:pyridoxal phosphate enzyme (YggS family)|nr:YggS family pyridoxal phosphate-dependent enzyme [Streptococcaceae bacterium]